MGLNVGQFLKTVQETGAHNPHGDIQTRNSDIALQGANAARLEEQTLASKQEREAKAAAEKMKKDGMVMVEPYMATRHYWTKEFKDDPNDTVNAFDATVREANRNIAIAESLAEEQGLPKDQAAKPWRKYKALIENVKNAPEGSEARRLAADELKQTMRKMKQGVAALRDLKAPGFEDGSKVVGDTSRLVTPGIAGGDAEVQLDSKTPAERGVKDPNGVDGRGTGFKPEMVENPTTGEKGWVIPFENGTSKAVQLPEGFIPAKHSDNEKQEARLEKITAAATAKTQEALAKGRGDELAKVEAAVFSSTEKLVELHRLNYLVDQIETGGWSNQLAAYVRGITGSSPANEQEALSMMQRKAIRALDNFPGQISDSERRFVLDMETNFGKTNDANRALIRASIEENERKIERARIVREAEINGDANGATQRMIKAMQDFDARAAQNAVGGAGTSFGQAGTNIADPQQPQAATQQQTPTTAIGQTNPEIDKRLQSLSLEDLEAMAAQLELR